MTPVMDKKVLSAGVSFRMKCPIPGFKIDPSTGNIWGTPSCCCPPSYTVVTSENVTGLQHYYMLLSVSIDRKDIFSLEAKCLRYIHEELLKVALPAVGGRLEVERQHSKALKAAARLFLDPLVGKIPALAAHIMVRVSGLATYLMKSRLGQMNTLRWGWSNLVIDIPSSSAHSIQSAIKATSTTHGAWLRIKPGNYSVMKTVVIDKPIVLQGSDKVTLVGAGSSPMFEFRLGGESGVLLDLNILHYAASLKKREYTSHSSGLSSLSKAASSADKILPSPSVKINCSGCPVLEGCSITNLNGASCVATSHKEAEPVLLACRFSTGGVSTVLPAVDLKTSSVNGGVVVGCEFDHSSYGLEVNFSKNTLIDLNKPFTMMERFKDQRSASEVLLRSVPELSALSPTQPAPTQGDPDRPAEHYRSGPCFYSLTHSSSDSGLKSCLRSSEKWKPTSISSSFNRTIGEQAAKLCSRGVGEVRKLTIISPKQYEVPMPKIEPGPSLWRSKSTSDILLKPYLSPIHIPAALRDKMMVHPSASLLARRVKAPEPL